MGLSRKTPLVRRKPMPRKRLAPRTTKTKATKTRSVSRPSVERLDELHRAIVMIEAGAVRMPNANGNGFHWYGSCAKCEKDRVLYVSHIEPKGRVPSLRWDPTNAFAFCFYCHLHWWHKYPRQAEAFRVANLAPSVAARLELVAGLAQRRPDRNLEALALLARLRVLAPNGVEGLVLPWTRG